MRHKISSREELEFLRELFASAEIGICVTDQQRRFILVNPAYCRTYGYSRDELIGAPFTKVVPPEVRDYAATLHDDFLAGSDEVAGEWQVIDKFGERHQVLVTAGRVELMNGQRYKVTTVLDISKTRQAEQELKRLSDVVSRTSHGVIVTDKQGLVSWVNDGAVRLTGYSLEEMKGRKPGDLLQGPESDPGTIQHMSTRLAAGHGFQVEIVNYSKTNRKYIQHLACSPVLDDRGDVDGYVALQTDLTEKKEAEQQIETLSYSDGLTNLPNRLRLEETVKSQMTCSNPSGTQNALLVLDLDNFKLINETLGISQGDTLLKEVARDLSRTIYDNDFVARLGGDEFGLILTNLSNKPLEAAKQAEQAALRLLKALERPFGDGTFEHLVTASVGAILFSGDHIPFDELVRKVDIALYQAKSAGGNTCCLFNPKLQTALLDRHRLEVELRAALNTDQIIPYYQGQLDEHNRLTGAEMLLRWKHPTRGLLTSNQFIPVAEKTGLINDIGRQALEKAIDQLNEWKQHPRTMHLTIAVNVSLKQLEQDDFVDCLASLLQQHKLKQSNLKLEITESVLATDYAIMRQTMQSIQALGISFSLDDFGTGYSSLAYLRQFPIKELKIDRTFVKEMVKSSDDRDITETIIALSRSLRMNALAEGVETEEQRNLLKTLGCTAFQGFLFDQPGPIDDFSRRYNLPGFKL